MDSSTILLPPELEEKIFVYAAQSDPDDASTYLLVAKHVREWVMCAIFEVVILSSTGLSPKRITLDQLKRYGHHVRHLFANTCSPEHSSITLDQCLSLCPDIEDLCVWMPSYSDNTIQAISCLPLKRLGIDLISESLLSASKPQLGLTFSNITHLDAQDDVPELLRSQFLVHFHALTHLAVLGGGEEDEEADVDEQDLFKILPKLKVVVWRYIWFGWAEKVLPKMTRNWKFVVLGCSRAVDEWEKSARGKEDMWAYAERIIRDRQDR